MNIPEEKYLEWFTDYFKQNDKCEPEQSDKFFKEWIDFLKDKRDKNQLHKCFTSYLYGNLGSAVRNYMRRNHPEIDEDFKDNYSAFEDYSWELLIKMIDNE